MNKWKMLMALLVSQGFQGTSVDDVKRWALMEGVESFTLKSGGVVKVSEIDDVYAEHKRVTVKIDDDEGDDEIIDERGKADPEDDLDDPEEAKRRKMRKNRQREQQDGGWGAGTLDDGEDAERKRLRGKTAAERHRNLAACKRYNRAAENGRTLFGEADSAEAITAKRRLGMAGLREYEEKARDQEIVKYWTKAGSVYDAVTGGILIPETYSTDLINITPARGTAREAAGGLYPMETKKEVIPRKGSSVQFGMVGEGVDSPTTQPTFDGVHLDAQEVSGLIVMPTRLLRQSAISIADFLATDIENSKKHYEDLAYWKGINHYTNTVTWQGVAQKIGDNSRHAVTGLSSLLGLSLTDLLEFTSKMPDEADEFADNIKIYCHRSVDELTFQRFVGTAGGARDTDITQRPARSFNGWEIQHVNVLPKSTWASGTDYIYMGPAAAATKMGQVNGSEIYMESDHRYIEKRQWCAVMGFELAINCHDVTNSDTTTVDANNRTTARASLMRALKASA